MFRRFVAVVLGLSLFGQGCTLPSGALSPAQEPPLGEPSPEGFVPFRDGFGFLPGAPRTVIPPAHRYTLVLQAAIPEVPSNVTILRARNAAPNDTLLRNVTTAVHVPAGRSGVIPLVKT